MSERSEWRASPTTAEERRKGAPRVVRAWAARMTAGHDIRPGNCCPAARATLRRLTRARSRRSMYTPASATQRRPRSDIIGTNVVGGGGSDIYPQNEQATRPGNDTAGGSSHPTTTTTTTHTAPGTQSAISLVHTFVATSQYTFHTVHVVVTVVVFRARITRRPSIILFYFFFSPQTPCVA